jgi:hypothetical protein
MTPVRTLPGSRLALFGAILYLLEWAFIIPSSVRVPRSGSTAAQIAAAYMTQPSSGFALLFAGLSVVLLGRIAFIAGVRTALRQTNTTRGLADFAFGAMTASVVLEVVGEVLRWTASRMAARGADPLTVVALHESFYGLTFTVGAALGISILAASLAMLLSREFPRWLAGLGLVAGAGWIAYTFYGALTGALPSVGGLPWLAWAAWLLTTGVILFRRAGPILPKGRLPQE